MGPVQRITESIVHDALPLPKVGAVIGGKKVTSVKVTSTDRDYYTTGITLERGAKRKDIQAGLSELLNCHILNSQVGDLAVRVTHFEMVPTKKGPTIYIVMRIVPMVYNNPGKGELTALEDFDKHYGPEFTANNPKKWFRSFPVKNPHGPAHRDKLWKFVGWVGESYGYCDKDTMYHRRASTIMPKIKITKAIDGANTFYHTHPSKDEPSLTSPDDYMLYFDLAQEPRNIRHFYTIMKDRIDYFKITPRKENRNAYVRIDQDKFLDEVDAKIDELMDKHSDDFPDDKQGGLNFCEKVTKETVKWLNKKYGKYVKITYSCFYRVRKNPEESDFTNLHLGDSFIARAIADIRSGDYSWPSADVNKMPQEKYAYWFGQYYFMDDDPEKQVGLLASPQETQSVGRVKDRTKKLGFLPGRLRGINHYLDLKIHEDYSNYDMMNLINLHIDIMRLDSDVTDGGGVKTRLEELAKQLELPDEIRDNLIMIEEARILGAHTEEAKTLSGDFYIVLLLVDLCQRAIEVMDEVRAGTKTLEYAKYEIYAKLKEEAIRLIDIEITAYMKTFNQGKKSMRLNPPPRFKKGEFEAFIPPEYLQATGIVTEALEQYAPYQEGKPFLTGRNKVNMRVPSNGTVSTVMIGSLNTGNLQIIVPAKGHPMPDDASAAALGAYQAVVDRLNEYGLNIPTEEQEVGSVTVSNPRKNNQLIIIAGPSGAGKSTTLRNLDKMLPNSKLIRSYVTRPKRKSDRGGEKNFVTEKQFKEMVANGEFLEHTRQKSGDYYGKRLEDFKVDADYLITESSLPGVNRLKKAFPNAFTIYLEPSESAEMIRKRLLRRGDMSPQQARGRSSKIPSHIKSSKMMSFDKRIITKQGQFDNIALEIMDSIPRSNPATRFRVPKEVVMENPIGRFRKKGFEKYLPKRGKETTIRQDRYGEDYEVDTYQMGMEEIEDLRMQLELMDAIDKLPLSEQEKLRTPIVRKFMRIGGKEILIDQSDELTPEEQDYLELQDFMERGRFKPTDTHDQGYYDRLTEANLEGRAKRHWVDKEVPSRIPFRKARVEVERVPIRRMADETIAFTTETEADSIFRTMKGIASAFSGGKSDDRDRYEKAIHSKIQAYSTEINQGQGPLYLLLGEIPDEVKENLSSTILELDAKLVDIKENHDSAIMKRKYEDDRKGEWEEYTANNSYLRGYKHRQSVKGEIPTMVETMIYDLYDMAFMAQLQSTTDHEFTHRADFSSYLMGTDYSQYDEDGNIISPFDVEQYGKDERTTIMSESSPQILQAQYPYVGIEIYPTNPGYYMGVIWCKEKYDYSKFRKREGKNLEEAEAREAFKKMSHGEFNQYYPEKDSLIFALVEATDSYSAKKIIKERLSNTRAGEDGVIYINPKRKVASVRIEESPNKAKKMVAYFFDKDGKKVKTTHFGARGMSDYTQHKDPKRKDNYLSRHGGMGEDWRDPTTAGALSRWILWGKTSLRESFNDYKKRFNIEGVMTVTNTRMNPSMDEIVSRVYRLSEKEKKTLLQRLVKLMEESGELAEEALIATGASGSAYKEAGKDGVQGETADAILILLSIYQQSGGSPQDLIETLDRKSQKWESKMNPSYTTKFDFIPGKEYTFDELPGHETGRVVTAFEQEYGPLGTSLKEDALHHFRSKEEDGYGFPGTAQEATYRAVIIPNEELVEQFGHLRGKPKLQKHIEKYGLDYPSIGNEGNNRRTAMAKLGRDMPHLEVIPARTNPMAPGYQSYAWTTQDWRSIKVNNKGEVDYSKKCGAEDTQVADGTPRLCLPAEVVRTLMKSKNGKEILLTQARKKARAAKGQRVPWHPRIKEIWKRVENKTVKDRPNPPRHNFVDEDKDPFKTMFV